MYRWNPALSEAIFANKIILVEGETEFACLTRLLEMHGANRSELDVHIIDCKGKGELPHFQRLLREMGRKYMAVHDSDVPFDPANAAIKREWDKNEAIWTEIAAAKAQGVAALGYAFVPDFERAHDYSGPEKPKMLAAINFLEAAEKDGTLAYLPISDLLMRIDRWEGNPQDIEELRTVCAP